MPAPAPSAAPIVETIGLVRRFGELTAVDHLDLAIEEGAIFGLLGPNGRRAPRPAPVGSAGAVTAGRPAGKDESAGASARVARVGR
jgi:hypothetical protein